MKDLIEAINRLDRAITEAERRQALEEIMQAAALVTASQLIGFPLLPGMSLQTQEHPLYLDEQIQEWSSDLNAWAAAQQN